MLKKNFVSIVFSANKLQILKLNSSKKKVEKHLTIDIPDGLIVNHKVQDVDILAKLLGQVWKKAGIKEKTVGLVVPEFSTFIKTLNRGSNQGKSICLCSYDNHVRFDVSKLVNMGTGT